MFISLFFFAQRISMLVCGVYNTFIAYIYIGVCIWISCLCVVKFLSSDYLLVNNYMVERIGYTYKVHAL